MRGGTVKLAALVEQLHRLAAQLARVDDEVRVLSAKVSSVVCCPRLPNVYFAAASAKIATPRFFSSLKSPSESR